MKIAVILYISSVLWAITATTTLDPINKNNPI